MIRKPLLIILFFSFFYPQNRDWSSTRFEKLWNTSFNQMQFREPISFVPYKINLGTFYYGDDDYFNTFTSNGIIDTLDISPFSSDNNIDFSQITDNLKYRKGISLEVDFLTYNFFKNLQNTLDIQFGLNYKFNQILKKVAVASNWVEENSSALYLRPTFNSLGFKTHLIHQWNPRFYNYIHVSHSYVDANFLEDINRESIVSGSGESSSIGLGIGLIKVLENKEYDLHYGIELCVDNLNINKIRNEFSHITNFKSQNIKLNFSIGIGYGGKKSIGDIAYSNLINNEYIKAADDFEKFININSVKYKKELAQEMMIHSKNQIAYDMFYNGVQSDNIDDAIYWYNKSLLYADKNLVREINTRKYIIARNLLTDFKRLSTIDESIEYLNKIKIISNQIEAEVNVEISNLMYQQADFMISYNKYHAAFEILKKAKLLNLSQSYIFDGKLNLLVSNLVSYINKFLNNQQFIEAYNYIILLDEICISNKEDLRKEVVELKQIIESNSLNKMNQLSQLIIENSKNNFLPNDEDNFIKLGDSYSKIIKLFGTPLDYIIKTYNDEVYTMIVYEFGDKKLKFYFKENILFELEEL